MDEGGRDTNGGEGLFNRSIGQQKSPGDQTTRAKLAGIGRRNTPCPPTPAALVRTPRSRRLGLDGVVGT